MARSCDCQKYLVLSCNNFVLGILGLILIILSIVFLVQLNTYGQLGPANVCGPPTAVLILGIVTFLLSVYSYKVISYYNKIQIILFLSYLGILFLTAVSIEIWTIVKYTRITEPSANVLEFVKESLNQPESYNFWNNTITMLNCCGVFGVHDYSYLNYTGLPESCKNDTYEMTEQEKYIINGCASEVLHYTKSVMLDVIYTILGLILFEAGIVFPLNIQRLRIIKERNLKLKQLRNSSRISGDIPKLTCDSRSNSQVYHIS